MPFLFILKIQNRLRRSGRNTAPFYFIFHFLHVCGTLVKTREREMQYGTLDDVAQYEARELQGLFIRA